MEKYEELKNECKDFSKFRIIRNMIFIKSLIIFANGIGLWFIDFLLWMIVPGLFVLAGAFPANLWTLLFFWVAHMIYWRYIGENRATELIADLGQADLKLMYKALRDVKAEKNKKS